MQDQLTTAGDQPAGAHWWSIAPDPVLPSISTRRAYFEVLFVFLVMFATGILAAGLLLAGHYKDLQTTGNWALYSTQIVGVVTQIAIAVGLVLLLGERRGVSPRTLGLTLPRREDGSIESGKLTRILAWCIFALVLGGIINAVLQSGHLPTAQTNTAALFFSAFDSIQAGVIEELVVLAFVVVTLRQAGRPWWEVTLIALVLRGSYHIYYGPGVFGILVWAALYYWIYLRFRSLIPMMVCHAGWDLVGFLSQRWGAVAVVGVLVAVGLWIAAPITWLVERSNRQGAMAGSGPLWIPASASGMTQTASGPPAPPAAPPPGWHPDPSGANQWRWWDGHQWTEHVSGHAANRS
jgi:Protein of unknown function (DUF2510)/Type II CAAX prenyl endopeptidase Rce1-like